MDKSQLLMPSLPPEVAALSSTLFLRGVLPIPMDKSRLLMPSLPPEAAALSSTLFLRGVLPIPMDKSQLLMPSLPPEAAALSSTLFPRVVQLFLPDVLSVLAILLLFVHLLCCLLRVF